MARSIRAEVSQTRVSGIQNAETRLRIAERMRWVEAGTIATISKASVDAHTKGDTSTYYTARPPPVTARTREIVEGLRRAQYH